MKKIRTPAKNLGVTPSKHLRDSLENLSNILDVKENKTFLRNIIPTKSQYKNTDA